MRMEIGTRVVAAFAITGLFIAALTGVVAVNFSGANPTSVLVLGGIALLLSMGFCRWVYKGIATPLKESVEVAKRLASGDLSKEFEAAHAGSDVGELQNALHEINERMFKIVANVRLGTTAVATTSGFINTDNTALSSRTESQASSLQQTASSMEQLTSTVQQNADNANQATRLVQSARQSAVQGGKVVGQVVETMGAIRESSKKIADIIAVIDGIAFQTNILALNAAVEAARAGEQGRGFAVVAAEVRSLAQRSASAAQEIKALILDSVQKVAAGGELVDGAGAAMEEIVRDIQRVSDIMHEIAAASSEQSSGIQEVNRAIMQIDGMTQQNAHLVEEASRTASSLQEQAVTLSEAVSIFDLGAREFGNAEEAENMVHTVVDYIRSNGLHAAVEEIKKLHKGLFIDRDLYAVIYSFEGKIIAHGANRRLWEADWTQIKDTDGKYFNREMAATLRNQNSGWIEYKWIHPLSKSTLVKRAYFEKVDTVFVACGHYKT